MELIRFPLFQSRVFTMIQTVTAPSLTTRAAPSQASPQPTGEKATPRAHSWAWVLNAFAHFHKMSESSEAESGRWESGRKEGKKDLTRYRTNAQLMEKLRPSFPLRLPRVPKTPLNTSAAGHWLKGHQHKRFFFFAPPFSFSTLIYVTLFYLFTCHVFNAPAGASFWKNALNSFFIYISS